MQNQTITSHMLFFDPLNKKVEFRSPEGKLSDLYYAKDREGVIVYDNGEVEFCYYAPGAEKVQVAGISGSMSRNKIDLYPEGNGYFSRRVSNLAPGFHYHDWFIDGNKVRNQRGAFCYGCFEPINFFEIPEKVEDFYLMKEVPHGEVRMELYKSSENGHLKNCYIYTPPKYHIETEKQYPVLYIQHGVGESETGWIWNGKLNFIMDNLLAEGKCSEMIVVMCSGYSFKEGVEAIFYPGDFDHELIHDCIPFMEENYRIKPGKDNRAIAGLSLGSAQATLTASKHQDMFSALGVFSGVGMNELDKILSENTINLNYVLLTAGEGEGNLKDFQEQYSKKLMDKGITCSTLTFPGFHEWHVWRKSLHEFVQNIFRVEGKTDNKMLQAQEQSRGINAQEFNKDLSFSSQKLLEKQTYEAYPLFFDPVYKDVIFAVDEKGRPAGRYIESKRGVVIIDQETVEFNFLAPNAESMEVQVLGMERLPLHKAEGKDGEEGYWTGRLKQVEPGFHYHEYFLNGIEVINPKAPVGYGCFKPINFFEMPEPEFDTYLLKDVPHGSIHMNYYASTQTGRMKLCYVYAPPGYEKNLEKRYPVLYLQHGGGENEIGWIWQGKIGNIMDNLLAEGKCKEMLIVMNTGYSFRPDGSSHPQMGSFDEEIVWDCIPFIERNYRTLSKRDARAMAGLSMGGIQTQKTVFHNPELFAWAGIFSGGLTIKNEEDDYTSILYDPKNFRELFQMLYVACGKQDGFYEQTLNNITDAQNHGIPLEVFIEKGYHDWTFWRHCVTDFLKKVFQANE